MRLPAPPAPAPIEGATLRELWARRGRHTVEFGGRIWARHRGPFYIPIAPEARIVGPIGALDELLRAARVAAVRAPMVSESADGAGAYVVDLGGYSLARLGRSTRRNVVRGLEACVVRRLEPTELGRLGFELNVDTLQRQRRVDPEFGEPSGWSRFIEAIRGQDSLRIHGAFVGGALASWTIAVREGAWLRLLWKFGRSTLRVHQPDHALDFTLLTEAALEPGLRMAVDGHVATLGDDGLDRYKRSHGFRVEPHQKVTRFHPHLAPLSRSAVLNSAVRGLQRALPYSARVALGARILEEQEEI